MEKRVVTFFLEDFAFASNHSNKVECSAIPLRSLLIHLNISSLPTSSFSSKNASIESITIAHSKSGEYSYIAHSNYIDSAVLTLQKEVAARLVASPRSKDYGSFTLLTEFHSEVKRLFNISKNSFYPAPKVDSTVVLLKMRREPPAK